MENLEIKQKRSASIKGDRNQRGSALVIAVFVLILVSTFVALALSRTASEAAAVGNEAGESRTFYAAQGSLEMMTRNFNKVFEVKLNPSEADLDAIRFGAVPLLNSKYTFDQRVDRTSESAPAILTDKAYAGLYAIRDNWRLETTATDNNSGIQVELTRNVLNNRIPIFQFGIFYDDDLELYRPPRFSFGGRVHSNRNFFLSPGAEGVYFDSRVTAHDHIITQTWRNGNTSDINNNQTFIKNASRVDKQLLPDQGSVLNTTAGAGDNVFTGTGESDLPPSKLNPNWLTQSAIFDGNLQNGVPKLKLPLNVGATTDLVEMIKRGKQTDTSVLKAERFANKTGFRVSLADSKAKLPGCDSGTGNTPVSGDCGIRLDGGISGSGVDPASLGSISQNSLLPTVSRGYQPLAMRTSAGNPFNYVPTRVNGERLYTGSSSREVWIKIETVKTDPATNSIITADITQDILSLGITEQAPTYLDIDGNNYDETPPNNSNLTETTAQSPSQGTDSRSVIKLQRFVIPGGAIPGSNYLKSYTGTNKYNLVVRYSNATNFQLPFTCNSPCTSENLEPNSSGNENYGHLKQAKVEGVADKAIVPFPIEMFDTREGIFYDLGSIFAANKVTKMGVMSMIDIDVANLRRFLRGDFNGLFPTNTPFAVSKSNVGLVSSDIPQKEGWVLYVSDRRGDADFDGEFDMEDIYGFGYNNATGRYYGSDGVLQPGEDVNKNNRLDTDFGNEAPNKYDDEIATDLAAVNDHKFYRRGVRLINGKVLPGIYDPVVASNTRGFTLASENGVYVKGNYNATHVTTVPSTGNTPYDAYRPFGAPATATSPVIQAPTHIPASIVADAVTILSNNWDDAKSFVSPYNEGGRLAATTQMRFAMISGDTIASMSGSPNQGGLSPKLNGGVHNFKRFLERWTGERLDYSGSLINLFYSHNNNGSFKCCDTVYDPPTRNWVFDETFLDPSRLPPGTPFFQYVQITGFQRTND